MTSWPVGDGVMAGRTRSHDWAATPLGPIAAWSAELKAAAALMLDAALPAAICCGSAGTTLYNDAFALFVGAGPDPFGRSLADAFGAAWARIGPALRRACAGEATRLADFPPGPDRAAWPAGAGPCASCSPIRAANGEALGAIILVSGPKGPADRHDALLAGKARSAFLLDLSDALRPLDDPGEIQAVASRLLGEHLGADRVGYAEEQAGSGEIAVLRTYTRDVAGLDGRDRFEAYGGELLARLRAGHIVVRDDVAGDPQPSDGEKRAHAALELGAAVDVPLVRAGRLAAVFFLHHRHAHAFAPQVVALIADTAERVWTAMDGTRARRALHASEARFRALVTASSDAIYRMSPDWSEMRQLDGRGFLADTAAPRRGWADSYILAEDRPAVFEAIERAIRDKRVFELEHRVRRSGGGVGWTLSRAVPLLTEGGEIREWFGAASDATARKRAEAALRDSEERQTFLLKLSDVLRPLGDVEAIQAEACRLLAACMGVDRACFVEIDEADGTAAVARDHVAAGAASLAGRHSIAGFAWAAETLRRGACHAIADARESPLVPPANRAALAALGITGCAGAPIVRAGALVGVLCVTTREARHWTDGEAGLLREVGERLWSAVERARAEGALRDSEQRFRQFAASSSDALWIRDAATLAMEYVSPAIETIYGVPPDELHGDPSRWSALIVAEDRPVALAHLELARHGEAVVHEFRIRRPNDGDLRWIRNTDFPLFDANGRVQRIGGIAEDVTEVKRAAERQKMLAAELQHRVRNILAMTRSVVARTAQASDSVEDFTMHLQGRLDALARAQAVLTRAPGAGVDLELMVREELLAQAAGDARASVAGPAVTLAPKTAEVLALALHELATNAVKHGALSPAGGRLEVGWSLSRRGQTDWLHIVWQEHGAPVAAALPRRVGFGTELIERRVAYELRGKGRLEFTGDGVRCTIELPLDPGDSILDTRAPGAGRPRDAGQ